jgi:phosphate transport system substrate-binding protein
VTDIIEVRFGYDGIVFASDINGPSFAFTPSDWYLALAANLPVDGAMVANPNAMWSDVNGDLPAQAIAAYIPGTRHGTREVFEENVILVGCEETGSMQAMLDMGHGRRCGRRGLPRDPRRWRFRRHRRRLHRDAGAHQCQPRGIGVFGLAFYENNTDRLQVATMSGIEPTVDSIASGEYPVSRPLFFYIKAAHLDVIPGLQEYAAFFVSDDIAGPFGPLAAYGLVADPELADTQMVVSDRVLMGGDM